MTINDESLQGLLDRTPDLVDYFRNDTAAPHFARAAGHRTAQFIPPAFTNWRDEQYASFETAALLHQSHHMPELFIEGPDALNLLKAVVVNSLENFGLDQAKQIVGVAPAGYAIGDSIAYRLGEEKFEVISGAPLLNWIEYQAGKSGYDVTVTRDDASNTNPDHTRTNYRFELAGPNVGHILGKIVEGGLPEIPFFRTRMLRIGGHDVLALRHGMVGEIAVELSGPYAEEEAVRAYLLEQGAEFGLIPIGTTTYFTSLQSGWLPYPVPGIFTDPALRDYREHLPAGTWEANTELGGSLVSGKIEDYYVTPYDLGYGRLVKFDHDFIGRDALEAISDEQKQEKVTFVWDADDIQRVTRSQYRPGPRYKSIDVPVASYSWNQFDEIRDSRGDVAGFSAYAAYIGPLNAVISLGVIDPRHVKIGDEVVLTWGEPGGGTRKRHVERHEQTAIRARVAPAPYVASTQRNTRRSLIA